MDILMRPDVHAVIDADGAVLLDVKHGQYFSLNDVAAEIWAKLEKGWSCDAIAHYVSEEFAITLEAALHDIEAFLLTLTEKRLVATRN